MWRDKDTHSLTYITNTGGRTSRTTWEKRVMRQHSIFHLWWKKPPEGIACMPFYQDRMAPLRLRAIWRFDYAMLTKENMREFDIADSVIYNSTITTFLLWRLCKAIGWRPSSLVLLQDMWTTRIRCCYVHVFWWRGWGEDWAAVALPEWLHISERASQLGTCEVIPSLAFSLYGYEGVSQRIQLLQAVVNRVGADLIDWGMRDEDGDACIAVAAWTCWMSHWWHVVTSHRIAYYTNPDWPIAITLPMKEEDWANVDSENKKCFRLRAGFQRRKCIANAVGEFA